LPTLRSALSSRALLGARGPRLSRYPPLFRSWTRTVTARRRRAPRGCPVGAAEASASRRCFLARRTPSPPGLRGRTGAAMAFDSRSEEHTSELHSRENLVGRPQLEKKNNSNNR